MFVQMKLVSYYKTIRKEGGKKKISLTILVHVTSKIIKHFGRIKTLFTDKYKQNLKLHLLKRKIVSGEGHEQIVSEKVISEIRR